MIAPAEQLGGGAPGFSLAEEDLQAVLLALAKLSLERPGWLDYLRGIAKTFKGERMFESFRTTASLPAGWPKDTANHFGVVRKGDKIQVLFWDKVAGENSFTLAGAVNLAAWLKRLADPEGKEFERVEKEIAK